MAAPYSYTQTNGTLDIQFEGEHVVLNPGDTRELPDPCTAVRFVNAVTDAKQSVRDKTPEGLEALQAQCTASGGGPGGASPPVTAPDEPPTATDPSSTDGGGPGDGQAETAETLGAPAPEPAGQTNSAPREPGDPDGRPLAQQYYAAQDPLTDYDVAQALLDAGTAPGDLDAGLNGVVHNEPPAGEPHPDFGLDDAPDQVTLKDPVELSSGQFVVEVADVEISSRGLPLRLVRHYRSGPVWFGPWGYNWDHEYDVYLRELSAGRVAVWTGRLSEDVFTPAAGGGFEAPVGGRELLEWEAATATHPDQYVLTDNAGTRRIFQTPIGYPRQDRVPMVRVEDRHGNGHDLTYDAEGRPAQVTDHAGRFIAFDYGDCGLVERVRDHTGRAWTYWHDDQAEHLVAVVSPSTADLPDGAITRYEYGDQFSNQPGLRHNITRIVDPDDREVVANSYGDDPNSDDFNRVVAQDVGGYTTTYTTTRLQFVPRTPDAVNVPAWRVEVDDPGNLFVYTFNYRGDLLDQRVRLVLDGSLRLVARTYRYDEAGNPVERYDPNGFGALMTYDSAAADPRARGNLLRLELVAPPTAPGPSRVRDRFTYEPQFHRIKTHRDELGHTTRFVYDYEELPGGVGEVIRIEYPDATLPSGATQQRHERFAYNAFGQLTEHTSGAGVVDRYDYLAAGPAVGHLGTHIQDATGVAQRQSFVYDALGRPVAFIDGLGNRTEHDIDQLGRLLAVRLPAVGGATATTRFNYLPSGRVASEERPRGDYADPLIADQFLRTEYAYDEFGWLRDVRYGANTAVPLSYGYDRDPIGNIHAITDPLGRRTTMTYDERWLLLSQTEATGLPEQATTRYRYDLNGNRTAVLDPAGHRVDFAYDAWDRLRVLTLHGAPDAERTRIRFTLNSFDHAERIRIDGLIGPGVVGTLLDQEADHDERGRVVRRRLAGRSIEVTHDADERPVVHLDQRGAATRLAYDGLGRVVASTDPLGNQELFGYDAAGRLTRHERVDVVPGGGVERFVTTVDHDARGRPRSVTDPLGRVSRQEYDDRDLLVVDTDPLGRATTRAYGLRGEVLTVSRAAGPGVTATHTTTWDVGGRIVGYRDPEGAQTRVDYDARDRRLHVQYPDGGIHSWEYDERLQPSAEMTPGGTRRDYTYRADGALERVVMTPGPGAAATPPVDVFSDGLRRAVRLTQGPEMVTRGYDPLRLVEETTRGGTVSLAYDDVTGDALLAYPDGRVDRVETDLLGRPQRLLLDTVTAAGGLTGGLGSGTELARYSYRGPDRVTERRHWNGWTTAFDYDAAARLVGLTHRDQNGTVVHQLHDVLDAGDRRAARWQQPLPHEPFVIEYDALDRVAAVHDGPVLADPGVGLSQAAADAYLAAAAALPAPRTRRFDLNLADARTAETETVGGVSTSRTYTLSPTYAVTSVTEGSPPQTTPYVHDGDGRLADDGQHTYLHDALGRLVEIRDKATGTALLQQRLDPLGRAARRTDGGVTTDRTHLGRRLLEERPTMGVGGRQLAYGPGVDELLAVSDGQNLLPLQDPVQSVVGYADDAGTLLERYSYDAFGLLQVFAPDGTTPRPAPGPGPALFAGHQLMGGRWYDARARVYDPHLGGFLEPDPFDYVDGANRYAYAHHDPFGYIDPDGDIAILVGLVVAAGVGLLVGAGSNAVRQTIQIAEGSRDDFSFGELLWSGATGAVLGPVLVVAPELAIPLAGMGVVSAVDQFEQGNWGTGAFDLASAVLPFASKNVRSATFGKGTVFSPARGLGPIEPFSTRWGRVGTMGREFLNPTNGVTRATHVTSDAGLQGIKGSNTVNPTQGRTGILGAVEGSREGSWVTPWRASQLRRWSRAMMGYPSRRPYVEFDVAPGELLRPGGMKWFFGRYQRQIAGPIDLTGRNPTFGLVGDQPPTPMLADLAPFMHLTIPGDPFTGGPSPTDRVPPPADPTNQGRQK